MARNTTVNLVSEKGRKLTAEEHDETIGNLKQTADEAHDLASAALPVGAFGWGVNIAPVVSSGSVNHLVIGGFYRVGPTVEDLPEPGTFIVEVIPSLSNNTKQRATLLNTAIVREYTRRRVSAGWSPWVITADVSSAQTFIQKKISFQNANDASPTVLDWYEEGTFTPVVQGSTVVGVGTYVVQQGKYTRVGNRVFFDLSVAFSGHTGTGELRVFGLPFVAASGQSYGCAVAYYTGLPVDTSLLAQVYPANSFLRFYKSVNNASATVIPMVAAATITISGSYQV